MTATKETVGFIGLGMMGRQNMPRTASSTCWWAATLRCWKKYVRCLKRCA